MSHNLSKSRYTLFRQCPKALWMSVYQPNDAIIEDANQARFDEGQRVGELAKSLLGEFYEATSRKADGSLDIAAMLTHTQQLMNDSKVQNICEASFCIDGCYCAVDILHREKDGWAIYEVKSSTDNGHSASPKEVYIQDISYQRYVLIHCGINVTGTYLVCLNSNYVLDGELDPKELFSIIDVSDYVEKEYPKVAPLCKQAISVLSQVEQPNIDLNVGCKNPYECAFLNYCMQQHSIPSPSVFDLYRLSWKKKIAYYAAGKISFDQLISKKLDTGQRIQVKMPLSCNEHIDKEGIRKFLKTIRYPLYHLDFETVQPVIPIYQGTHPYQQIPFQYSLHIESSQGARCEHREFLADANSKNPMRELAEQLCRDIPAGECVLVYNDSFEKTRLKEMADAFPDLHDHLMAIRSNIVDLLVPFRNWCYYTPAMSGSFSIKKVLPALFPDDPQLDYHNLTGSVHNGGEAMDIFPRMRNMQGEELTAAKESLLRYCELDTWSMVVILRKLYDIAK